MVLRILLVLMFCGCLSAQAAINMFLRMDPIQGESLDQNHRDQMDVLAWSWGMSMPLVAGGGGTGRVNIQDISITKYVDKASPALMLGCSSGTHYKTAVLSMQKSGASATRDFMVITLEDVIVTSYNTGGSAGGDLLTENIALNFSKVRVEYWQQRQDGSYVAIAPYGWDVKANVPL
ncbi:MAG TPA: type VI secretion system tube protein Hcp [Verrucomicrobiae bacterium]|nr:type VI secretion system tube protein Hcp [Verrucomicrobiae bacterium]